jgi:hypothetical protein
LKDKTDKLDQDLLAKMRKVGCLRCGACHTNEYL